VGHAGVIDGFVVLNVRGRLAFALGLRNLLPKAVFSHFGMSELNFCLSMLSKIFQRWCQEVSINVRTQYNVAPDLASSRIQLSSYTFYDW